MYVLFDKQVWELVEFYSLQSTMTKEVQVSTKETMLLSVISMVFYAPGTIWMKEQDTANW